MKRALLVSASLAAALSLAACQKKQEPAPPPAPAPAPQGQMPPAGMGGQMGAMPGGAPGMGGEMGGMPGAPAAPREVVVPPDVKAAWKGVVLQLTDKKTNKTQDVKVDIGQSAKVGELDVKVEAFLPSFTMGGGNITSKNNNTENPAAKVVVTDKGAEVFSGWLFSLYPQAHPMQHEKYGLALKDFIKK